MQKVLFGIEKDLVIQILQYLELQPLGGAIQLYNKLQALPVITLQETPKPGPSPGPVDPTLLTTEPMDKGNGEADAGA